MRTTHRGMNISDQEYLAVVDNILEAMDLHNSGNEKKKRFINSFPLKE